MSKQNEGMKTCPKCGQTRPIGENPIAERAWDILHEYCPKLTFRELIAAVNEFAKSKDLVKAAIAAAFEQAK